MHELNTFSTPSPHPAGSFPDPEWAAELRLQHRSAYTSDPAWVSERCWRTSRLHQAGSCYSHPLWPRIKDIRLRNLTQFWSLASLEFAVKLTEQSLTRHPGDFWGLERDSVNHSFVVHQGNVQADLKRDYTRMKTHTHTLHKRFHFTDWSHIRRSFCLLRGASFKILKWIKYLSTKQPCCSCLPARCRSTLRFHWPLSHWSHFPVNTQFKQ